MAGMRGVLLLVVGLGAGLAAGWTLFAAGPPPDRAGRNAVAREAPERPVVSSAEPAGAARSGEEAAQRPAARPGPSAETEEQVVRRLMAEAYAERVKGERAPEGDLFEAGVREVMRRTAEYRESGARNLGIALEWRERTRVEVGEIRGSPLLLQMRVTGGASLRLDQRGKSGPLRIDGPPPSDAKDTHVTGGLVPPGQVFLIERVVLRAWFAPHGRLSVALPGTRDLHWKAGPSAIEREMKGLARLRHGEEGRVGMNGGSVAAALEIHGRLVPEAEGEAAETRPLIMGDGWLTGEPVLMQVLADHGGGNPRTLRLDGELNSYLDSLGEGDLWSETVNWRNLKGSWAYYRGCGRVPAGKAYRITRVDYRARLNPEGSSNSHITVRIGGKDEIKADASQGATASGSWTGDVLVFPGGEEGVSLTGAYFALAEMTVFGELVDDAREKR